MNQSRVVPAALGGLLIGVLSSLPLIQLGNVCCCLWIVGGGYLAGYLLQQNQSTPVTTADGAVVGLLAGVFGAVVAVVVGLPVSLLMRPFQGQVLTNILNSGSDLPPAAREIIENMSSGGGSILIGMVFQFCMMLVLGAIFATIGGVLAVVFHKRSPAPPVASQPPPPVPPPPAAS